MQFNERWRQIKIDGEAWPYEVSDQGNVRRSESAPGTRAGYILKPYKDGSGYSAVHLCRNGKIKMAKIHRLVASAFLPAEYLELQVNHKDGCKANNNHTNLEWCTATENMRHADDIGLRKVRGEDCHRAVLTEKQVYEIRALKGEKPAKEIGEMFGVGKRNILHILNRERWKHLPEIKRAI